MRPYIKAFLAAQTAISRMGEVGGAARLCESFIFAAEYGRGR
jgi:hypothetical protein